MDTIVTKFGGTSLADANQIRKVADILRADSRRRYAVASAPGKRFKDDIKVTDLLLGCYDLTAQGGDWQSALTEIENRFRAITEELAPQFPLTEEIALIRQHLETKPDRDYMASRGEYLNSKIIAAYLGWSFVDAAQTVCFTAYGTLDEAKTQQMLGDALAKCENAVIPGFFGALPDGTIKTFSRGGSDVTGALVAQAVEALEYENWTDVSGMLFTDPRIADHPRTIEYITYRELRELSYMGASVLHEDAVFPVRKAGIPIHIRNTNRPSDEGTRIVAVMPENAPVHTVTGVAGKTGFCSLLVEKSMMNNEVGFGAKFLDIFSECGVPFEHCPTGIDTISVVVNSALFAPKRDEILRKIQNRLNPDSVTIEDNLAMVAVVGYGMISSRGVAARVFRALADAGINIHMIDQGSSELNIIVGINESDFQNAIRCLAKEFR